MEHVDEPWSHATLKLIFNDGNDAPKTIPDEQLYKGMNAFFPSQSIKSTSHYYVVIIIVIIIIFCHRNGILF